MWFVYRNYPPSPETVILGRYRDSSGAWHEGRFKTCRQTPPCCVSPSDMGSFDLGPMVPPDEWRYPEPAATPSTE